MKTAPAALVTLINGSNVFEIVDLYDIALANGDSLRWTSADHPITYPATGLVIPDPPVTFFPTVGINRAGVESSCRLDVQSMDVTFLINESVTYGTTTPRPLAAAALEGLFDGAEVTLYRGFIDATTGLLVDVLLHFKGTVADVKPSPASIEVSVKSELDKLNQQMPRNTYQPACDHAFLDDGCDPGGTLRTANTFTGALIGTPTRFTLVIPSTYSANNFQLGVILMTSGELLGQRRGVRSDTNGGGGHALTLAIPFPRAPLAGDTFSLTTGCDRTLATCTTRFSNAENFRGFPFVPRPEEQWR